MAFGLLELLESPEQDLSGPQQQQQAQQQQTDFALGLSNPILAQLFGQSGNFLGVPASQFQDQNPLNLNPEGLFQITPGRFFDPSSNQIIDTRSGTPTVIGATGGQSQVFNRQINRDNNAGS